jgi:hypothetical protein
MRPVEMLSRIESVVARKRLYFSSSCIIYKLENTCMQKPLALLTKPLYFPNMKYLK